MKILFISQYYSPDITAAAFRISETARYLHNTEDEITVLTAKAHRAATVSVQNESDGGNGPKVHRCAIRAVGKGGAVSYILHYMSFVCSAILKTMKLAITGYRPDVIWCSSPPLFVGIIGLVSGVLLRAKVIYDIRDIWPESAVAAGLLRDESLPFRCGKILEKTIYARAKGLTCVANPMRKYLTEKAKCEVSVVYNGISAKEIPDMVNGSSGGNEGDKKTLMYIGNLGRVQGLDMLVKAFVACNSIGRGKEWRLRLVGDGAVRKEIEEIVEKLDASHVVELVGSVPKDEALSLMHQAQALFLSLVEDPILKLTIPSKVFDYMAAGCPIVGVFAGEGTEILAESGGNVVRDTCFQPEFESALKELFANYETLRENSHRNLTLVRERYTREAAANVLRKTIQSVTNL